MVVVTNVRAGPVLQTKNGSVAANVWLKDLERLGLRTVNRKDFGEGRHDDLQEVIGGSSRDGVNFSYIFFELPDKVIPCSA